MIRSMMLLAAVYLCGCSNDAPTPSAGSRYVLGSVVIDADGNRTTYVQTADTLDGPFSNENAIELPGNGVLMAHGSDFFVGLAEAPIWVRYAVKDGSIEETGRLSFLAYGQDAIDYGNVVIDDETAVSVFSNPAMAVVWNPKTMKIVGATDLGELVRDGYELEVWTTVSHDGLVYIPGRWSDWKGARIYPEVSTTIFDPKRREVLATLRDDRCASGGRVVFAEDGKGYVMGDGRDYSIQMFANAAGTNPPQNCLLRFAPGESEFDADYFYDIKGLTGGPESITELQTASDGSSLAFAKMFHQDQLPHGVTATDFGFWDVPVATEVDGSPFASIGFDGSALGGKLYTGESTDGGATSEVYETDPASNAAHWRFVMAGYFDGLYELSR